MPIEPAFTTDLPHGRCVGVAIPPALTPELAAALHPAERAHLTSLPPGRQPSFAAGRAALRQALAHVTGEADAGLPPCLPDDRGAPQVPRGTLGSISHKRSLAIALAAPAPPEVSCGLGVDLEELRPLRVDLARRVLTPDERVRLAAVCAQDRDRCLIEHFSLKESLYKAVNGLVGGPVWFRDVEIARVSDNGHVEFALRSARLHGLDTDGWLGSPHQGHIVSSACARLRLREQ